MWIARDDDGSLTIFTEKPIWVDFFWKSRGSEMEIDPKFYPEVTFDNSPVELKAVI